MKSVFNSVLEVIKESRKNVVLEDVVKKIDDPGAPGLLSGFSSYLKEIGDDEVLKQTAEYSVFKDKMKSEGVILEQIDISRLGLNRRYTFDVVGGVGSVLVAGSEAVEKLVEIVNRKGIKIDSGGVKLSGRLGYNDEGGFWEYHSSFSKNEHEKHWKRFGSSDDGRGYYILTSNRFILLLKSNDDKVVLRNSCDFLCLRDKAENNMVMGDTFLRKLKVAVKSALDGSKGDNKVFINILLNKGVSKSFMSKYSDEIKKLVGEFRGKEKVGVEESENRVVSKVINYLSDRVEDFYEKNKGIKDVDVLFKNFLKRYKDDEKVLKCLEELRNNSVDFKEVLKGIIKNLV